MVFKPGQPEPSCPGRHKTAANRLPGPVCIGNRGSIGQHKHPALGADLSDIAEEELNRGTAAQYLADWLGDVRRRQGGGCNLIEQGLEQVVIVAVDDRHPRSPPSERLGNLQTGKATADHDDARIQDSPMPALGELHA
ncbi:MULTISPECIES: hypothetical protein [Mesorhizobium]|uniref:hypothetical protein n=1 Tax=Mesorhizobium sp. B2-3-15 TaxID=2589949 RepID=UPI001FDA4D28|nr:MULTISPECIES: hypothetical protein [Mesorhizobium]